MARMRTTAALPESVQEARERLEMDMDAPGTRESMEGAANGLIVGPADPAELLGCQDEGALQEGELTEFAVTAEHGLRLRERPSLDAPVLAVLPRGAGVFAGEPPRWRMGPRDHGPAVRLYAGRAPGSADRCAEAGQCV